MIHQNFIRLWVPTAARAKVIRYPSLRNINWHNLVTPPSPTSQTSTSPPPHPSPKRHLTPNHSPKSPYIIPNPTNPTTTPPTNPTSIPIFPAPPVASAGLELVSDTTGIVTLPVGVGVTVALAFPGAGTSLR